MAASHRSSSTMNHTEEEQMTHDMIFSEEAYMNGPAADGLVTHMTDMMLMDAYGVPDFRCVDQCIHSHPFCYSPCHDHCAHWWTSGATTVQEILCVQGNGDLTLMTDMLLMDTYGDLDSR